MDTPIKSLASMPAWTCDKISDHAIEISIYNALSMAQARRVCGVPDPGCGASAARLAWRTGSQPDIPGAQPTRARGADLSGRCTYLHAAQDALRLDLAAAPAPHAGVVWLRLRHSACQHLRRG